MAKKKKVIAVIPARGGSKRLKNKNVLMVGGKPMIVHTIEAALGAGIFDNVLISTDAEPIARLARRYGAEAPFLRDKKMADDRTPVSVATVAAVKQMEQYLGCEFNTVVQLMANCPCRTAQDIRSAYAQFKFSSSRFQISAFPFGFMNPRWAMTLEGKVNRGRPLFPEAFSRRSQDMAQLYCPTGAVWIADGKALKTQGTFYGAGYTVFVMDWRNALDIDDAHDLNMAKAVFHLRGLPWEGS